MNSLIGCNLLFSVLLYILKWIFIYIYLDLAIGISFRNILLVYNNVFFICTSFSLMQSVCDLPQLHLLSVRMETNLHRGCPPNCQDFLTWLPTPLAAKIMTYLDPGEQLCGTCGKNMLTIGCPN